MTRGPERDGTRLRRTVEIAARLRATELRVDESEGAEVRHGRWTSLRHGLPPSGARQGVTYREVEVGIRVEGEPASGDPRTDSTRRPRSHPVAGRP